MNENEKIMHMLEELLKVQREIKNQQNEIFDDIRAIREEQKKLAEDVLMSKVIVDSLKMGQQIFH